MNYLAQKRKPMSYLSKLILILIFLSSCRSSGNDVNDDKCSCYIQQYKRTVILKKLSDGSLTNYSDTGWNVNGDKKLDNSTDCSKNETIQGTDEFVSVSSEYHRTIYLKWVYVCN